MHLEILKVSVLDLGKKIKPIINTIYIFPGFKIAFPFKDKELNKIAAFFNLSTFLLTCAALVQPSWFRIKGLHCTQSLSLSQFFTFDDDDDEPEISIHQNTELYGHFNIMSGSDYNGKSLKNQCF